MPDAELKGLESMTTSRSVSSSFCTQLAGTDPEAKPLDESESSFGLLRRLSFRWLAAEKVQPDDDAGVEKRFRR